MYAMRRATEEPMRDHMRVMAGTLMARIKLGEEGEEGVGEAGGDGSEMGVGVRWE
jgi:hypothetical protein